MHPHNKHLHTCNDAQPPDAVESVTKIACEHLTFDMHQVVSLNKMNYEYEAKHQSRTVRFLNIFRCIANRPLEEKKAQQIPSPINECNEIQKTAEQPNERFHIRSYEVSNSSLQDIENGALEDELTIYMKEIQRREKDNS